MKLILAVVASVLAVTGLAAPQIGDPSISVAPPQLFKLQSQVVNDGHNDCGTDKNNLWLTGFHTGAGLSDATMQFNRSTARQAYLNGTQLLTTYPNNTIGPWPMAVSYIPYSIFSWVTVSIASTPNLDPGFFFNETGLQFNDSHAGWAVCDWYHGVPQLFNIAAFSFPDYDVFPSSCSKVNLIPVAEPDTGAS